MSHWTSVACEQVNGNIDLCSLAHMCGGFVPFLFLKMKWLKLLKNKTAQRDRMCCQLLGIRLRLVLFYFCPRQLFLFGWSRSSFKRKGRKVSKQSLVDRESSLWEPGIWISSDYRDQISDPLFLEWAGLEGEGKSRICSPFLWKLKQGECAHYAWNMQWEMWGETWVKLLPDQIQDTGAEVTANEFRFLMHFVASRTAAFSDYCFKYPFVGLLPIVILLIAKYVYCVKIMSCALL